MIAINLMMRTKYDCNENYNGDQIWLQSWSQKGPNMNAISVLKGTRYDCNLIQKAPNMIAMSKIVVTIIFGRISRKEISIIAAIFGPFSKRLQSYLVRIEVEIAFILGPHRDHHCNHISSLLLSRLQLYLVAKITSIAIIFGPFWKWLQSYLVPIGVEIAFILTYSIIAILFGPLYYQDCNHI